MGLLKDKFKVKNLEDLGNPSEDFITLLGGGTTSQSGVIVNESTALSYSAVLACVTVISETIASLPLVLYERTDKGKKRNRGHPLNNILLSPNPEMTRFTFIQSYVLNLLLNGNAYAHMEFSRNGQIKSVWPLFSTMTEPMRLMTGELIYRIKLPDALGGENRYVRADEVVHTTGLTLGSVKGLSPIGLAREAIGLGLSTEAYASKFYKNNARPSGVIEYDGELTPQSIKTLREGWNEAHEGLDNSHKVAVLEYGMKYNQMSIPQKDAQFIESRKFQLEEIARIYRVPLHKLQHLDHATFSNIEHQDMEFVKDTIRPWLVRTEQSFNKSFFTDRERSKFFLEFNVDGLLRGDTATRFEAYHKAINDGWLSGNEVRQKENWEERDELNDYFINGNMRKVKNIGGDENE